MGHFSDSTSLLGMFYHWAHQKLDETYLRQSLEQRWTEYTWVEVGDLPLSVPACGKQPLCYPRPPLKISSSNVMTRQNCL